MQSRNVAVRSTIAFAAVVIFGASVSTSAQSAARGDRSASNDLSVLTFLGERRLKNDAYVPGSIGINPRAEHGAELQTGDEIPTPDFSAMNKWYEIKKREYDKYAKLLNLLVVINKESRPWNFGLRFLDEDGTIVFEPQICGLYLSRGAELNVPIRCPVPTPSIKDMKRVKKIVAIERETN